MSKREQKLIDIAKRFRKLKYRLNNFYQYQVMVNYKHVLLVGDTHQPIGEELIKAFGNTWQIGNIGKLPNEKCHFNLQVDFEEFAKGGAKKETIESITQQIEGFSKHFECILCLPGVLPNVLNDIKSEAIFEQYETQRAAVVEPGLLASHIATRHLTNNGSLMFFSDANSFSKSSPESIAAGIAQEQLCLLNLSLGDREFLEVDAFSYALLQGESIQQGVQTSTQETTHEGSQQQQSQSTQSSETGNTSVQQTKKTTSKEAQIAKYVKQWADGIKRPISGTFIKFPQKDNFMYPELI